MKNYLIERRTHLKKCELDYFTRSINRSLSFYERTVNRTISNEFQARRNELDALENYLKDRLENVKQQLTSFKIENLTNEFYDLNLQNLNPRLAENESFKEGIEVGINDFIEFLKNLDMPSIPEE